jgi:hypothetical protein
MSSSGSHKPATHGKWVSEEVNISSPKWTQTLAHRLGCEVRRDRRHGSHWGVIHRKIAPVKPSPIPLYTHPPQSSHITFQQNTFLQNVLPKSPSPHINWKKVFDTIPGICGQWLVSCPLALNALPLIESWVEFLLGWDPPAKRLGILYLYITRYERKLKILKY